MSGTTDYVLLATQWDEPVETDDPRRIGYRRHRRGDVVKLDEFEAARLLAAGAIGPVDEDSAEVKSAKAGPPTAPDSEDESELPPVDQMTVAQLRDYAKVNGIGLGGATAKADVLAAVQAANQGETATPPSTEPTGPFDPDTADDAALDAYVTDHQVDLGGATTREQKVAVIQAHLDDQA